VPGPFSMKTGVCREKRTPKRPPDRRLQLLPTRTLAPDANGIEQLIGGIEGRLAPVVKEVGERLILPSGDNLELLIKYVALLSVRNPAVRRAMNDS
jgi:hypothetical protein